MIGRTLLVFLLLLGGCVHRGSTTQPTVVPPTLAQPLPKGLLDEYRPELPTKCYGGEDDSEKGVRTNHRWPAKRATCVLDI